MSQLNQDSTERSQGHGGALLSEVALQTVMKHMAAFTDSQEYKSTFSQIFKHAFFGFLAQQGYMLTWRDYELIFDQLKPSHRMYFY